MPDLFAPQHRRSNLKVAAGQWATVTASDSVDTGLDYVFEAVANLDTAPAAVCDRAQASVPSQATVPGFITINTYKPTASGDATPIAATTPFAKTVSWIAFGW